MTESTSVTVSKFYSDSWASHIVSFLLGVSLLSILFHTPGPIIPVAHPYKAELILAFVLLIIWLIIRSSGVRPGSLIRFVSGTGQLIAWSILAFTALSAISIVWADSSESVVHHTLLWGLYLGYFVTFVGISRHQGNLYCIALSLAVAGVMTGILCTIDYVTMPEFELVKDFIRVRYGKYGELMSTIAPFLLGFGLVSTIRHRWMFALASFAAWSTAMLALSKGAFLAGIAGFVVFFIGASIFSRGKARKAVILTAAIWIIFTVGFQVGITTLSSVPVTTDYISGEADPTRASSELRLFIWKVGLQMAKDNVVIGVGADNFGNEFNNARASYRKTEAGNSGVELGEDFLMERAHNEAIQVIAELGMIGLILFVVPFAIFAIRARYAIDDDSGTNIVFVSCVGGICAFAISSMVSSFSMRSAQNGAGFILVFAAAVALLIQKEYKSNSNLRNTKFVNTTCIAVVAAAILMVGYCGFKISAEFLVNRAENTTEFESAKRDFETALMIDPEYAGAYLSYGARLVGENDRRSAAEMMEFGTKNGIGLTITYSQIARHWAAAGENERAIGAYLEAIRIYPRSVYIRVEYATFLESLGRIDDANASLDIARSIDAKLANTWYLLIKEGSLKTFQTSQTDPEILPPSNLIPQNAVLQYTDEVRTPPSEATQ